MKDGMEKEGQERKGKKGRKNIGKEGKTDKKQQGDQKGTKMHKGGNKKEREIKASEKETRVQERCKVEMWRGGNIE